MKNEGRSFQEIWILSISSLKDKTSVCWICLETVAIFKACNIKRHYQTNYSICQKLTEIEPLEI